MARKYKDPSQFGAEAHKRTALDVQQERDMGYGRLHDFGRGEGVTIHWSNWGGPYEDDMLFRLDIASRGDREGVSVVLSKEEMLRWLRWV